MLGKFEFKRDINCKSEGLIDVLLFSAKVVRLRFGLRHCCWDRRG